MISSSVKAQELSDSEVSHLSSFVENFYRLTDDGNAHEEYGLQFLPNASLIFNHSLVQGREAIINFRKIIWAQYTSQTHFVEKVLFLKEPTADIDHQKYMKVEAIIFGKLASASDVEESKKLDWAGRGEYVSLDGIEWKVQRYQVYLNSKPVRSTML